MSHYVMFFPHICTIGMFANLLCIFDVEISFLHTGKLVEEGGGIWGEGVVLYVLPKFVDA